MTFSSPMPLPLSAKNIQQHLTCLKQHEIDTFSQQDVAHLLAQRSGEYDKILNQLWQDFKFDEEQLALIAVGGYGRQEMFPMSDLDILILYKENLTAEQQERISQFIQLLWDCHFDVGHSVRTISECIENGLNDLSIATNLLESRFICGNKALFDSLTVKLKDDSFWSSNDFFNAKLEEKKERYARYNNTAYNLEPDIKYSPGGLRDSHLLYWIALRHVGAKSLKDILDLNFIYPEEYQLLFSAQNFLFKMRYALHLVLKRYDNRLLFDRQLKVSEILGYSGQGNEAVEAMMKNFFMYSQKIRQLSELLCQHYEETILLKNEEIATVEKIDDNFECINQRIKLRNPDCFATQPASILDLFYHLTQYKKAKIHSSTLRHLRIALSKQSMPLVELPEAREKLINLMHQERCVERAFVPMHYHGVLSAYFEQWNVLEGLMQFDLFHAYTVDEHIMRVMQYMESFLYEHEQKHPICASVFKQLPSRAVILSAALFHDIAKGRHGDHSELGAIDAYDFALNHGFNEEDSEMLAWLVLNHLQLSVTAQRRDIYDPEVVLNFANSVKYHLRLDYLLCLTVADICGTNQTLWNDWKRSLITTLYRLTKQQLELGTDEIVDSSEIALQNRLQALSLLQPDLQNEKLKLSWINAFWNRMPKDYFLRNTAKQIAWHTELVCKNPQQIIVKVSNRFAEGATELFVYSPDQPNLFNRIVRAIESKNVSIHDAQIMSTSDGHTVDSFMLTETDGIEAKFDRRRDVEIAVYEALLGEDDFVVRKRRLNNKLQNFTVETEVHFLDEERNSPHTELELFALDRPGLLAIVSNVFSEFELNIVNAKISTIGERAEDFFILTNKNNKQLSLGEQTQLRKMLYQELKS